MYMLLIAIHVLVCLVLISVILLQAGRGGGLTEMVGGETAQSFLGTQAPTILKKATTASAIAFLVTSLLLGMITARRGRSLFEGMQLPAGTTLPETATAAQQAPMSVPQGSEAAVPPEASSEVEEAETMTEPGEAD